MNLTIQLIVLASCAVCKLVGELWWHNAQRFFMPAILAGSICYILHSWVGILCLPMIAPFCIGYATYGNSDGFNRAVWLMFIVIFEGLLLTIFGHISWFLFIPWVILSAVWGGTTRQWLNIIIAPLTGAIIGAIIFLVR